MARFRDLIRNKNFFCLWLGLVLSQFGDRLNQMVLIGLVHQKAPGSTLALAKLFSATIIPAFIIGPIAGAYVDRWNKKLVIVISDILRAALLLLIPLFFLKTNTLLPTYTVIFLIYAFACFLLPARLAIIPDIVEKERLLIANSLFSTSSLIAAALGYSIGGVLIENLNFKSVLIFNSSAYLIAAAVGIFITARFSKSVSKLHEGLRQIVKKSIFIDIKEGLQYLTGHKEVLFVAKIFFILTSGAGAAYVVSVVFVQQALGSITKDIGLLSIFLCLGLLIGTLFYGRFGTRFDKSRVIFLSLLFSGIALCGFAIFLKIFPSLIIGGTLSGLIGLSIAPIATSTNTLIHEEIHDHMMGRIFSSLGIVMNIALLIFMFLAAAVAEIIDRQAILICIGAFFAIYGVVRLITYSNKNRL